MMGGITNMAAISDPPSPRITVWEAPDPLAVCAELQGMGFRAYVGNDKLLYLEGPEAAFIALCREYVRRR